MRSAAQKDGATGRSDPPWTNRFVVRASILTVTAALCCVLTSCDTNAYATAIADFGTVSSTVFQQVRSAYALVNDTTLQAEVLALTEARRQQFERDLPAEMDVLGLVDHAHSPSTEKIT